MAEGEGLWVLPENDTQTSVEDETQIEEENDKPHFIRPSQRTYNAEEQAIRDSTNAVVKQIFEEELVGLLNLDYSQPCTSHQRATFSLDEVDNEELMQNAEMSPEEGVPTSNSFIHRLNSQEEVQYFIEIQI